MKDEGHKTFRYVVDWIGSLGIVVAILWALTTCATHVGDK